MSKKPSDAQIADAVSWLRHDTLGLDIISRKAVADWLEHLQREAMLKTAARKAGVSMRNVRKYIKRVEGKTP